VTIRLPVVDFLSVSMVTMRPSGTVMEILRLKYWTHGPGHKKRRKNKKRKKRGGEGKEKESGKERERERGRRKEMEGKGKGKGIRKGNLIFNRNPKRTNSQTSCHCHYFSVH